MKPNRIFVPFALAVLALALLVVPFSALALRVENEAASGISRTNATFNGTLVTTNGTTNALYVYLFWATSDYTTNTLLWPNTNIYLVASTGAVSTNVTGLTPATQYYYRWYALEGTNLDWPAASTNFWTLSGVPTGAPPTAAYNPVMSASNTDALAAGTNFFAANTGRMAQAGVVLTPALATATGAVLQIATNLADIAAAARDVALTNSLVTTNDARAIELPSLYRASNVWLTATGVGVKTNAPVADLDVGAVRTRGPCTNSGAHHVYSALPTSTNGFTESGTLWRSNEFILIWFP